MQITRAETEEFKRMFLAGVDEIDLDARGSKDLVDHKVTGIFEFLPLGVLSSIVRSVVGDDVKSSTQDECFHALAEWAIAEARAS